MIVIDARMINASGIGRYIRNILPFLLKEFNLKLLGNEQELKKYFPINSNQIINVNSKIYSIQEQFEIARKIPQCDIFWSPHYNIPILPIKAKKRMVTIHDVYHLAFKKSLSLPQKIYASIMIKQTVKRSDIILTVSEFSKSEIKKYVPTNKDIKVIYNGIDLSFFDKPVPLKEKGNYILYVGNIKPHKNLVKALKAFSKLKIPEIKFKIVGEKDNFITIDKEVKKIAQKLGNRVEFTGYVSDDELKELYRKAKLFLFPSLYEGFGLPPLEAMASGTPVIVSNVASLPEVCGDAAFYINPYDINDIARGIETVLKDEDLQRQLIQKGLERVKLFSWEKSAQKLIEIIEGEL
ncbi:glycosyltransferase family 1 protein [Persephonella sp. KM09-Lau-8]|uniref:glycosyltransferase family 4 protein n=1 Tax=Persephonella sp. KM09-Lau-8 TaxID=1158345 RepID=UPI000495F738|nr:glycosyltransferase family 1 protein [Persephonella sp. KM09-Lau-8]